jgi:GTPase SAR1 family protein
VRSRLRVEISGLIVIIAGAEAAVVCYDLTDAESWDKVVCALLLRLMQAHVWQVKFWVKEILTYEENCILALVGTKLDLVEQGKERGVPPLTVQLYATTINAKCYETSSLTGQNVAQPFVDIVKEYSSRPRKQIQAYSPVISLHDEGKKEEAKTTGADGKPCCGR